MRDRILGASDLQEVVAQQFVRSRQTVPDAQILAVGGSVLSYQGQFPDPLSEQPPSLADDRLEMTAPEAAAQLRNDAERARMVAAFVDLDVGEVPGRGASPRRQVVIQVIVPRSRWSHGPGTLAVIDDGLDLASAENGIDIGDLCLEFPPVPFHQAARDDQPAGVPRPLVLAITTARNAVREAAGRARRLCGNRLSGE